MCSRCRPSPTPVTTEARAARPFHRSTAPLPAARLALPEPHGSHPGSPCRPVLFAPPYTADGVASLRKPVCSCGPVRCAPLQPRVRLELPNGGLRLRGDFELRLFNAGVVTNEKLG